MSVQKFQCPACGASLDYEDSRALTLRCPYCNSSVIVPESLRVAGLSDISVESVLPLNQTSQLADVVQQLQSGNKIGAIKVFRELFSVGLKEAKDAIEQMETGQAVNLGRVATVTPAPFPAAGQSLDEIKRLAQAGKKIEAIKRVRQVTGLGLADAKAMVERIEAGAPVDSFLQGITTPHTIVSGDAATQIYEALQAGNKIQAIKMLRDQTGIGLKEAKETVEAMELGLSLEEALEATRATTATGTMGGLVTVMGGQSSPHPLQPVVIQTEQRRGGGCGVFALLGIAALLVAFLPLPWHSIADRLSLPADDFPSDGQSLLQTYLPDAQGIINGVVGEHPIWQLEASGIGQGQFDDARQLALDGQGNVYVADFDTGRVQKFSPDGDFISLWRIAGDNVVMALAADSAGRVYVARSSEIGLYDGANGELMQDIPTGFFGVVSSLVTTADGAILLSTSVPNEEVVRRDSEGRDTLTIPNAVSSITGKPEPLLFAVEDHDGNIFVLGRNNNTIIKYDATGRFINRFGSVGDEEGQFRSNTALALAVDSQNRLYLGHFGGILVYDNDGRYLGSVNTQGVVYDIEITQADEIVATSYGKVAKYAPFVSEP